MAKKDTVKKTTSKVKKVEVEPKVEKKEVVEIIQEEKTQETSIDDNLTKQEVIKEETIEKLEENTPEEIIEKEVEVSKEENNVQPTIKRIFGYIWNGQIFG